MIIVTGKALKKVLDRYDMFQSLYAECTWHSTVSGSYTDMCTAAGFLRLHVFVPGFTVNYDESYLSTDKYKEIFEILL